MPPKSNSLALVRKTLAVAGLFFALLEGVSMAAAQDLRSYSKGADGEANGNPTEEPIGGQSIFDDQSPITAAEARVRARMLHETIAGALQVMHRDFFREDQKLSLPSKSLEDVFRELAKRQKIQLRWLAVNADAMTIEHEPQSDFDRQAVAELAAGRDEFSTVENNVLEFAGSIRLSASCLKCHVRNRTSNDERKAALVIRMPLGNVK